VNIIQYSWVVSHAPFSLRGVRPFVEGTDVVLLSPGKAASGTDGDVRLTGEPAFARRHNEGALRSAALKTVHLALGEGGLSNSGPAAVNIKGQDLRGKGSRLCSPDPHQRQQVQAEPVGSFTLLQRSRARL